MKKRIPSKLELENDPSLRWNDYKRWEVVMSDVHSELRRFHSREGDQARLATVNGMEVLPELVPLLSIRRPVTISRLSSDDKHAIVAGVVAMHGTRNS
jgi:hypothetical protein